jgi:EpsI family protein
MSNVTRFMPAGLLLMGCVFVWNARSQDAIPLAAPLTTVMADFPGYQFTDQKISDEEARIAGMTTYSARIFRRDSVYAFSTLVSYYERQTQGKTIHSPRNCLPGAGWEVLTAGTTTMPLDGVSHTINRYVLKNGAATALVFYWYQGRGRIVANEYAVKWNLLRDAALAGHTEEALVRVVVPVEASNGGDRDAQAMVAKADSVGTNIAVRLARDVARVLPRA